MVIFESALGPVSSLIYSSTTEERLGTGTLYNSYILTRHVFCCNKQIKNRVMDT